MRIRGALRAKLLAIPAVTTLAGNRVTWMERPQTAGLPAITLQMISGDWPRVYGGLQETRTARVQMDCWAETPEGAQALFVAAVPAVGARETVSGVRFIDMQFENEGDSFEPSGTKTIYRTRVDLIVWHSPA